MPRAVRSKYTNYIKDATLGKRNWYVINAKDLTPGRIAAFTVPILMGKHKPIYYPGRGDCGDEVIIINSKHIHFSGSKWTKKFYRWHSRYAGGFKEYPADFMHFKDPTFIVRTAIKRMLPNASTKTRKRLMERLRVFPEEEHPYTSQKPKEVHPHEDYPTYESRF